MIPPCGVASAGSINQNSPAAKFWNVRKLELENGRERLTRFGDAQSRTPPSAPQYHSAVMFEGFQRSLSQAPERLGDASLSNGC